MEKINLTLPHWATLATIIPAIFRGICYNAIFASLGPKVSQELFMDSLCNNSQIKLLLVNQPGKVGDKESDTETSF